ncbi:unnamed protein product [Effrenium voratum]|uniref:Uncharacterized protein n=1 Tax=Effrenium voratum TaxID=2562239 RepID=A0AA36J195_9DINO|nr:unnamed protein product [Effrenium voratum]
MWVVISSPPAEMARMQGFLLRQSFLRDRQSEALLQPFAMLRGLREDYVLQVFRRARGRSSFSPWSFPVPALCSLTIVSAIFPERCYFGTTYGCSNEAHIWVTDGCNAWFRRGGSQGACISDAGQAVKRSEWSYDKVMSRQFVECFLPEVPEPTGRQVMEICAADQDSLDLELVEDDHWRSPRIPVGQHQAMLSVRLPFDAVLEVSTYSAQLRNSGWASAVLQLDGECRAWNVVPFLGFHISFEIWNASTRGRERLLLAKSRMPQFASFMPMAWSGADLRVRSSMVHKEGILGMYDVMDPGSHWGNGSRIWQEAGRLQPGRSLETALRRADGLAALILALRLAVAWMLQEKVPAALLAAVYSAVQLADGPLRDDAVQLLEDTMKEPGDTAGPVQVLHGAFPRLVFSYWAPKGQPPKNTLTMHDKRLAPPPQWEPTGLKIPAPEAVSVFIHSNFGQTTDSDGALQFWRAAVGQYPALADCSVEHCGKLPQERFVFCPEQVERLLLLWMEWRRRLRRAGLRKVGEADGGATTVPSVYEYLDVAELLQSSRGSSGLACGHESL